ncbi:MAG: transporter substrate-binding domain-containing protein [Candidatus Limivicinus sp.]|nr:transporter substrate-binding domain-containing protein [Candidatus Limivicinus sp.]
MKKFFAIVLALAMILSCTACGGSSKAKGDLLEEIKAQGYIELCTEPYFAPFEFVDPSKTGDDQYVGVDIEIAKYIAEKIGVELRIVPLDFTAVLAGIADGKYDMAISAIAYSPSRAEAMRLSNVYKPNSGGYGFLTRTEDVDKYSSVEDLKDAVVITQSGSVQESLYNQNVKACKEFKLVANMTDGYLAVAEGKADVCICSTESAQLYAEANGGLAIPDFRFEVDPNMNGTVVAMPLKDSESLLEVVNEAIAELNAQGKIDQWNEEYTAYAAQLGIS